MEFSATGDDRFDMGRVVSRAFGVIGRNIVLFMGLALLLSALPAILFQFLIDLNQSVTPPYNYLIPLVSGLVNSAFTYILVAALSYAMISDLDDARPTFGKALGVGLRYALPLFLLAILSLLGIYAGLLFLLVPGVMLATMWCVAAPAMVTEQLGITASLGRSRALTKGSRWPIFGLLLGAGIVLFVPLLITPLLTGAIGSPQPGLIMPRFGVGTVIQALLGAGASVILNAILAAIYVELRTIKEGASTEALASIFA
jgi:hypothetical protein